MGIFRRSVSHDRTTKSVGTLYTAASRELDMIDPSVGTTALLSKYTCGFSDYPMPESE